ncbi:MAG: DNA methylase [Oscillospiraceae bacterium]|nr:DNA methylase [Oscillospiraceae bacterium]
MERQRQYIAIDLKSFYASQECIERGVDPLTTHLVVADESRTEKTICLAVSPSLKACGVSGRARLFEAIQRVREVNAARREKAPGKTFRGKSCDATELEKDPSLELGFIIAKPRMGHYIECSARIYEVYLRYIAPEDIHVYSIDEVFIDATPYLKTYHMTAHQLARKLIREVLAETGITATAGIGTNLYLCKVAMDIVAKKIPPDEDGVRIAELDELSYRRLLWGHRPLTDFWRVGPGYARKLERNGMYTMGDVARCSLGKPGEFHNEDLLYRLFGINAEFLIDHAWGYEPCTIGDIRAYRPATNSVSSGQVLHEPYDHAKTRLVVREMADMLSMDLLDKGLVTDQVTLTIGYDKENLTDPEICASYRGAVVMDHYGRRIPKHAHGTMGLGCQTASTKLIVEAVMAIYDRVTDPSLLCRRITLCAEHLIPERDIPVSVVEQMDLFATPATEPYDMEREKRRQMAVLSIRKKYGKNAILKGMNFQEGATAKDRNEQIGGHKA